MQPSPCQRLIHNAAQLAEREPQAAFARLEELYGKSLDGADVQALCAFAANLGGAVLGRLPETLAFLDRLLTHSAIRAGDGVWRSIQRARSALLRCQGDEASADQAAHAGATDASEQCRLSIMTAQTLVARQLASRALPFLKQASALCQELAATDEIVPQAGLIAAGIARLAEQQVVRHRELLLAAASVSASAAGRSADWRQRHMGLFQRAKALVLAGQPNEALATVQRMMQLEAEHEASPFFQFQSASMACRAQLLRGQIKIARGAHRACRDLLAQISEAPLREQATRNLAELDSQLSAH